jgi:hypothetical protein
MSVTRSVEGLHAALAGLLDAISSSSKAAPAAIEAAWGRCERAFESLELDQLPAAVRSPEGAELARRLADIECLQALLQEQLCLQRDGAGAWLERVRKARGRLAYYAGSVSGRSCDLEG